MAGAQATTVASVAARMVRIKRFSGRAEAPNLRARDYVAIAMAAGK